MSPNVAETGARQLRPNQHKALSALAAGADTAQAAEEAGVTARTLQRWQADDDLFRAELRRVRVVALDAVRTRAAADAADVYCRLRSLALDVHGNDSVRLAALRDMLRLATISDVEDRLTALEEKFGLP